MCHLVVHNPNSDTPITSNLPIIHSYIRLYPAKYPILIKSHWILVESHSIPMNSQCFPSKTLNPRLLWSPLPSWPRLRVAWCQWTRPRPNEGAAGMGGGGRWRFLAQTKRDLTLTGRYSDKIWQHDISNQQYIICGAWKLGMDPQFMAIFMRDDSPVEDEWIRALEAGSPSNENKFFWSKKFGTSRILKDTPVHGLKDGKNLVPSAKFHNKSSPPFVSSRLHPGTMLDVPFQSIS